MIFSSIKNHDAFETCLDVIKKALDYLASRSFTTMRPGVYEIQGKEVYAQVFDAVTTKPDTRKAESHEKYLDIQYPVSDRERLGFTENTGDYQTAEHTKERDLIFYQPAENEGWTGPRSDCFRIFPPPDIHRPRYISGESMRLCKVVVKVSAAPL